MKIKIYADGADIHSMKKMYQNPQIKGFTTNPSLMKKAGITDYSQFAKEVLAEIPDAPISFEVFSDDLETMEKEARKLASMGKNVYVKIPVTNSKGEYTTPLVKKLSAEGICLNVTAIFTIEQVKKVVDALDSKTPSIVSVFAGRIADTGVDPMPLMKEAALVCAQKEGVELLWASSRELINIFQAQECGADIITCTTAILEKLPMIGKDLEELSLETVQMFVKDSKDLGFSIL